MSTYTRRCFSARREGGDAKKRRQYLPPDRQYLVTRNGESGAHTQQANRLLCCSAARVPQCLACLPALNAPTYAPLRDRGTLSDCI